MFNGKRFFEKTEDPFVYGINLDDVNALGLELESYFKVHDVHPALALFTCMVMVEHLKKNLGVSNFDYNILLHEVGGEKTE
jgi:tRNA(Ile2) C34 agmatinyltransferase TiaS